jgi:hypothetical protein
VNPATALVSVLLEPRKTFEGLREMAPWILPVIVLFVIIAGFTYVNWPYLIDSQIESVRANEALPEEAREQALAGMIESRDNPNLVQVFVGPTIAIIVSLIGAGIWLLMGNVMMGGYGTFKTLWSAFNYAGRVSVVEMILTTIMIQMKGSAEVYTSLALIAPSGLDQYGFTFRALNAVDVFSIWFFVVMAIGTSVMCKVQAKKAMTVSFVVWAIWAFGWKGGVMSVIGQFIGM